MLTTISPIEAKRLIDEEGALLVDIREPFEFAREHIDGARIIPLSVFGLQPPETDLKRPAIYYCQSGRRTKNNAEALEKRGFARTYDVKGGLNGWKKAGLPFKNHDAPIPLARQLQIVAGGIITVFSILAFFFPVFIWLTLLIGLNLLFAGSTGLCFMESFLSNMPWNRKKH